MISTRAKFGKGLAVLICATAFALSVPCTSSAQSADSVPAMSVRNRMELQGGIFRPRRSEFNDLYGTGLNFGIRFEHRISPKVAWSVRSAFMRTACEDPKLTLVEMSLAPTVNYTLTDWHNPRLFVGAGPGVSYRRVSFTFARTYPMDDILSYVEGKQDEYGMFVLLMAGLDLDLGGRISFGGRVYFDRYLTGDPTVGDLGDTGGFHFVGVFGFGL